MKFRYRYVNFGTNFQPAAGDRADSNGAPERLHANEIALDVGSSVWSGDGEAYAVVDNHFYPHPFPSAAAGVLHLAGKIHRRFVDRQQQPETVWLVSHRQPDFDAFCAMYLAREVISGTIEPDGWADHGIRTEGWCESREEIDWYRPAVGHLPSSRRWPVLLAAYASCVDKCRPIDCPRHRGLHSVLYAALLRGRPYLAEDSGALQFFAEVQQTLSDSQRDLNPLYDSVLEASATFAPELALLDRQQAAYERDVRRARKTIVFLQHANVPFGQWYSKVASTALALPGKDGPVVKPEQVMPAGGGCRQADGIYLRDPECLLFKEWVRNDLDNSSMRHGFTFTAIAYSNERPNSTTNTTSYFFSLDPERAERCHLYNVWARLQIQELQALQQSPPESDAVPHACRPGFEARAGKEYAALFGDPWFDGSSYEATIVATPGQGTAIAAPGATAADLSDDPLAWIVQEELELAFFRGELQIWNFSTSGNASAVARSPKCLHVGEVLRRQIPRAPAGTWRFASTELSDEVDLLAGTVAEQIGKLLWRVLDPDSRSTVPTDFVERHLIRRANWVGIWSRQGIVIAIKAGDARVAEGVRQLCQELSGLATAIDDLSHRRGDADELLVEGDELVRRVVHVKHELTLPENHLVRRFFESIRLDELLHSLRDINTAAAQRAAAASNRKHLEHQQEIAARLQKNVERITAIQRIVHAIEYLVVAYYGVMLWGHLFPHYDEGLILLIPIALAIGLVVLINHSVERHWVEWAVFRRSRLARRLMQLFRPPRDG